MPQKVNCIHKACSCIVHLMIQRTDCAAVSETWRGGEYSQLTTSVMMSGNSTTYSDIVIAEEHFSPVVLFLSL